MHIDPGIIVLKILAVAALVLLNGFFVAAEFALVKIRDAQLQSLVAKGSRRAIAARHVAANLDRYLSAAQLGITLASLALGWVGEPVFSTLLAPLMEWADIRSADARHRIAIVFGFSVITFLHITAGEQAPKWFAIQRPLATSLWVAEPLVWFARVTAPFIWVLNHSSVWLLARLGIQPSGESALDHSEDELRLFFATTQKLSGASGLGRDIVLNALDLKHRVVRDVMRPRNEITVLDTEASMTDCLEVAEKTRFSRFPLCEGGNPDRTVGVVHLKDMFAMRNKARLAADLVPAARKLIYIPETCRLERLLQLFLERKLHFAVVVDEYGGTVGIVTLENLLEVLVGPIQDEFDQEKPELVRTDDTTWEVSGTFPVRSLEELVGEKLEEDGVTTTSGFVTQRLGGFPKAGDALTVGGWQLAVEEMDGPRVARLKVQRIKTATPDRAAGTGAKE